MWVERLEGGERYDVCNLTREQANQLQRALQNSPYDTPKEIYRRINAALVGANGRCGTELEIAQPGVDDACTCDPDADGTTDLFCPVHGWVTGPLVMDF